jgi:hypothetical protein
LFWRRCCSRCWLDLFANHCTLRVFIIDANVAQLVEQRIRNAQVIGSIPIVGSMMALSPATDLLPRRPGA